jgi:hypothetical protein
MPCEVGWGEGGVRDGMRIRHGAKYEGRPEAQHEADREMKRARAGTCAARGLVVQVFRAVEHRRCQSNEGATSRIRGCFFALGLQQIERPVQ